MKKVLFTAKVDSHIKHFHIPFLKEFKKRGYEVHVASEGDEFFENCDKKFNLIFGTNPLSKTVINSYKQLKEILIKNKYDVIHTHTAIASVLTRVAAFSSFKKEERPRIIYTAHGFHFLKGGKKISWILYYPIEYLLSKVTDDLILINTEDYNLAERKRMGKNRHYIPGVGVDLDAFSRKKERVNSKPFIITYIAELNENKNQSLLIDAFKLAHSKNTNLRLKLVGSGVMYSELEHIIDENSLSNEVLLLGYRTDIKEILEDTDLVVATSKREGLPINIIESMAMGLPIIATKCRGHIDLVKDNINGYLVDYDAEMIAEKILKLSTDEILLRSFSKHSVQVAQEYSLENIIYKMNDIYFNETSEG